MTEVLIEVRGTHTTSCPPDVAAVRVTVRLDGPEAAPVLDGVRESLALVQESINDRFHAAHGPVVEYSVEHVVSSSHRPWSDSGEVLPLVHQASVAVTADFTDFSYLGGWLARTADIAGLTIDGIDWKLLPAHLAEVEREVRRRAVRDAVTRAEDYSRALGLGSVQPRRVADPGAAPAGEPRMFRAMAGGAMMESAGGPAFDLTPRDLQISAEVQASFVALADRMTP